MSGKGKWIPVSVQNQPPNQWAFHQLHQATRACPALEGALGVATPPPTPTLPFSAQLLTSHHYKVHLLMQLPLSEKQGQVSRTSILRRGLEQVEAERERLLHPELAVWVNLLHRHLLVLQGECGPGLKGGSPLRLPPQLTFQVFIFKVKWEGELHLLPLFHIECVGDLLESWRLEGRKPGSEGDRTMSMYRGGVGVW